MGTGLACQIRRQATYAVAKVVRGRHAGSGAGRRANSSVSFGMGDGLVQGPKIVSSNRDVRLRANPGHDDEDVLRPVWNAKSPMARSKVVLHAA